MHQRLDNRMQKYVIRHPVPTTPEDVAMALEQIYLYYLTLKQQIYMRDMVIYADKIVEDNPWIVDLVRESWKEGEFRRIRRLSECT